MNKLTLSGLALALLITLAWTIIAQTQVKQNAAVTQQKCESPFYSRPAAVEERERFANDPVVQNFELTRRIEPDSFAEAAKSGSKLLIPYLEYEADVHRNSSSLIALIKIGDETRFNKLVNQTRCVEGDYDGSDYSRQREAIRLLTYVKTPAAYQVLHGLLDDTALPVSEGDMARGSRSELVMYQLSEMVNPLPNGLGRDEKTGRWPSDEEKRLIWKKWLETNNFVH